MTILELSASKAASYSALSAALRRPVLKTTKKPTVDAARVRRSMELLSVARAPTPSSPPPLASYHELDWKWTSGEHGGCAVLTSGKSVCLHGACESCFETRAARGNTALKPNAFTYWELAVETSGGTSQMLGVATRHARLVQDGYVNLLGADENSWALAHTGLAWHAGRAEAFCEPFVHEVSARIGCLFDGYNGQLSFYKDGKCVGVAFDSMPVGVELYPIVASTRAQTVFTCEIACESFPSLKELCRARVKAEQRNGANIDPTRLPRSIVNFLNC